MRRRSPRPAEICVAALARRLAPLTVLAEIQRLWPEVVGMAVADAAAPVAERGGTVTVACATAVWAQELDLMGPVVVERINARLGRMAVSSLRCRVASPRPTSHGAAGATLITLARLPF